MAIVHLLDDINLKYDIIVNKFNPIKLEEREKFQNQIKQQIIDCQVKGFKVYLVCYCTKPK